MAREIKYFSGADSGTLYTVPSGRTAKVIINHLNIVSPAALIIGGVSAYAPVAGSLIFGVSMNAESTATSTLVPGCNQAVGTMNGVPAILNNIWYLGPGMSLTATSVILYSFIVIEEF